MRSILLAAAALSVLAAEPAAAQYYGGPDRGGFGGGFEDDDYDYAPRRSYRRDYDERDFYGPPRRGPSRRAQLGSVCVTARGNCDAGRVVPRNSPCSCFIPGFGRKRGAIGF
jgi:hypothetical protein